MYYYYYYYYGESSVVKINLKAKSSPELLFQDLQEFIDAIQILHKAVIYYTQPEYSNELQKKNIKDVELLDYHQLRVTKLCKENPLDIELFFEILNFNFNPYWAMWKILIRICKRYGKNDEELLKSTKKLLMLISQWLQENKANAREKAINDLLGLENYDLEKLPKEVYRNIAQMLSDKDIKDAYNFFCSTAIVIADLTTIVDTTTEILIPIQD